MSTGDLSAALSSLGIHCEVEEQGKLAVIIPTAGVSLDAKTRRTIVALGRTHGFTNVCLELSPGV
jgi:hypothetical protein